MLSKCKRFKLLWNACTLNLCVDSFVGENTLLRSMASLLGADRKSAVTEITKKKHPKMHNTLILEVDELQQKTKCDQPRIGTWGYSGSKISITGQLEKKQKNKKHIAWSFSSIHLSKFQ